MRDRIAALAATIACVLAVGVAPAEAWTNWANGTYIRSGESVYGPYVQLTENLVEGRGSAIICAGIRYYGLFCPPVSEGVIFEAGKIVKSEPYAHDHSSYQSGFNAWYEDYV